MSSACLSSLSVFLHALARSEVASVITVGGPSCKAHCAQVVPDSLRNDLLYLLVVRLTSCKHQVVQARHIIQFDSTASVVTQQVSCACQEALKQASPYKWLLGVAQAPNRARAFSANPETDVCRPLHPTGWQY